MAQIKEEKVFANGGLDLDTSNEYLERVDYIDGVNIRISDYNESEDGSVTFGVVGNTNVSIQVADQGETAECIGAFCHKVTNTVYYFIWESGGNHSLLRYNASSNTIDRLIRSSSLNFNRNNRIHSANLVNNRYLYWVDGFNEPRSVDVQRTDDVDFFSPIFSELNAIKPYPTNAITYRYVNDTNFSEDGNSNTILDDVFSFACRFVYRDNTKSVWGIRSKMTGYDLNISDLASFKFGRLSETDAIESDPFPRINATLDGSFPMNNADLVLSPGQYDGIPGLDGYAYNISELLTETDPNNLINGTTGTYTAPETDVYRFRFDFTILFDDFSATTPRLFHPFTVSIRHASSNNVIYEQYFPFLSDSYNSAGYAENVDIITDNIPLQANDQLIFYIIVPPLSAGTTNYLEGFRLTNTEFEILEGEDPTEEDFNAIELRIPTGDRNVKAIEVAARGVQDSFYHINNIVKADLGLSDNSFYTFNFYNNIDVRRNVNPLYFNRNQDFVPRIARAQEYIKGNRIAYANINEGFDKPYLDVTLTTSNEFLARNSGSPITYTNAIRNQLFRNGFPTLKRGGEYRLGIVYSDEGTRNSLVFSDDDGSFDIKPPYYNQYGLNTRTGTGVPSTTTTQSPAPTIVNWSVAHNPPSWARTWQWVMTRELKYNKFIYGVTGGGGGSAQTYWYRDDLPTTASEEWADFFDLPSTDEREQIAYVLVNITNFMNMSQETIDGRAQSALAYEFQEGDRFRAVGYMNPLFLETGNVDYQLGTQTQGYVDLRIDSVLTEVESIGSTTFTTPQTFLRLSGDFTDLPLRFGLSGSNGLLFEIYNATRVSESTSQDLVPYFEIGEAYRVSLNDQGQFIHEGETRNQVNIPGTQLPATGTFGGALSGILSGQTEAGNSQGSYGDVFFRRRRFRRHGTNTNIFAYVEDSHPYDWSPFSDGRFNGYGRPHIKNDDLQEQRHPLRVRFSDVISLGTNQNGLSTAFEDGFRDYEEEYGSIQRLVSRDSDLIMFCENKVANVLVGQEVINSARNEGSNLVTNISAVLSNSDPYKGDFGVGVFPESVEIFGNDIYFLDPNRLKVLRLGANGITPITDLYNIKSLINERISFTHGGTNPQNRFKIMGVFDNRYNEYILSFVNNSGSNSFTIGFSEDSNKFTSFYSYTPEQMVQYSGGYITWSGGQLYTHRIDSPINSFYGTRSDSSIEFVFNESPVINKVYRTIKYNASSELDRLNLSNNLNQSTNLISSDFKLQEGQWYSGLYRDVNSPGGLLDGDEMRSRYLICEAIKTQPTTKTTVFSFTLSSDESEGSR